MKLSAETQHAITGYIECQYDEAAARAARAVGHEPDYERFRACIENEEKWKRIRDEWNRAKKEMNQP